MPSYFLYAGCLISSRLPFLEASSRFVLDRMGIDYLSFPRATCCVEPIGLRSLGYDAWLMFVGRMLSIASTERRDVISLCNGCFLSFKEAIHHLERKDVRERINRNLAQIGLEYRGGVEVKHIAEVLKDQGESAINALVKRPLKELRLACHPGCHLVRPSKLLRVESYFSPMLLGKFAEWIGAQVVYNELWPRCCGGGLAGIEDRISEAILRENTELFKASGANCILTPCPFCFLQFDLRQKQGIPVLFLPEMIALAFGASAEQIGLRYHRTKLDF
ncbi:MAG: CoB--CoM heterodisulfide reductase iron-sulfur subunit B family protein [Methanomassiliicoccales archaeon]